MRTEHYATMPRPWTLWGDVAGWAPGPLKQAPGLALFLAHETAHHSRPRSCGGPQPSFLPLGELRSRRVARFHAEDRRLPRSSRPLPPRHIAAFGQAYGSKPPAHAA